MSDTAPSPDRYCTSPIKKPNRSVSKAQPSLSLGITPRRDDHQDTQTTPVFSNFPPFIIPHYHHHYLPTGPGLILEDALEISVSLIRFILSSPCRRNPSAVDDMATTIPVPELSDADYFTSVLQLPEDRTESQIEDDLVEKASALGISIATPDKRVTSSVESASTVATYHARTFSMLSIGSDSTALTNYSSLFGPSSPDPSVPSRRASKELNFSHYDRYLSIIDPHHTQHKSLKKPAPPDASSQSIFSGKTKKTLFGKSGFKIRWKKKSPQPLEVMLLVYPHVHLAPLRS